MTNHENIPTNSPSGGGFDWMEIVNKESLEAVQQLMGEARAHELIVRIEDDTEYSSLILDIIEHPSFQELLEHGEHTLRAILSDRENFGHTHNVAAQMIADSMGTPIQFSEEAWLSWERTKEEIIRWLAERYSDESTPTESN